MPVDRGVQKNQLTQKTQAFLGTDPYTQEHYVVSDSSSLMIYSVIPDRVTWGEGVIDSNQFLCVMQAKIHNNLIVKLYERLDKSMVENINLIRHEINERTLTFFCGYEIGKVCMQSRRVYWRLRGYLKVS